MIPIHVRILGSLSPDEQLAVRQLVERATLADGLAPLSEQTLIRLAAGRGDHLVLDTPSGIVGYATVEETGSAELVVDPDRRRRGAGRLLAGEVARLSPVPIRVWAHGDLAPAQAFAAAMGWRRHRELLHMSRELAKESSPAQVLDELRTRLGRPDAELRAFDVDRDGHDWLAVNRAAFADHPEQGRWQETDLADRVAAPWFDPARLVLLWLGSEPIGFCWLKVPAGDGSDPAAGEIYVLALAPNWQGHGLGSALTRWAIAALAADGLRRITLYVEGDNTAARAAYEHAGFQVLARDCQYGPA